MLERLKENSLWILKSDDFYVEIDKNGSTEMRKSISLHSTTKTDLLKINIGVLIMKYLHEIEFL